MAVKKAAGVPVVPPPTGKVIQELPLAHIVESEANPREGWGDLGALSQDIARRGVVEPILVRPMGDHEGLPRYEIVFGHRRFRASQMAELATIPAMVQAMTYAEALETMIIENEQREDVSGLERSAAYQRLLEVDGYDVKTIAEKIGMSTEHVYDHLKLTELVPDVRAALQRGAISTAHAVTIARLPAPQQQEVFTEGLFKRVLPEGDEVVAVSVRELTAWIKGNLGLDARARRRAMFNRVREQQAAAAKAPPPPAPPRASTIVQRGTSPDDDGYVEMLIPARFSNAIGVLVEALVNGVTPRRLETSAARLETQPAPIPVAAPAAVLDTGQRCTICGLGPAHWAQGTVWSQDYARVNRFVCTADDCRRTAYQQDSAVCAERGIPYVGPESVASVAPVPAQPAAPAIVVVNEGGQLKNEIDEE